MKYITILIFACSIMRAQVPQMLKDIYPGPTGSYDGWWSVEDNELGIEYNGGILFMANDSVHGNELWFHANAYDSTYLLKDISPGIGGSTPGWFQKFNNKVYFIAGGWYCTDGTENGTVLVSSISVNNIYKLPDSTKRILLATDASHGQELWITDGTSTGTTLLKDIWPGTTGSGISKVVVADNGLVFFAANDNVVGTELWVTDGTPAGTNLVKDIRPGTGSSNIGTGSCLNGLYYFTANDGVHGSEVWVSDGTPSGTYLLNDYKPGSASSSVAFQKLNSTEEMLMYKGNPNVFIKTNGSIFDTIRTKPDPYNSTYGSNFYKASDGNFYYVEHERLGAGLDSMCFYKVDTLGVFTFLNDTVSYWPDLMYPTILEEQNNKLIYYVSYLVDDNGRVGSIDIINGKGNAISDDVYGTFATSWPGFSFPYYHNRWYFMARASGIGWEYYSTNGNDFELLKDINPSGNGIVLPVFSGQIKHFVFNDELYFLADDGGTGMELWKTDGTEAGTIIAKDIYVGSTSSIQNDPGNSDPSQDFIFVQTPDNVYFIADDAVHGREMWCLVGGVTGIDQKQNKAGLICYPNPANDRLFVKMTAHANELVDVKVIDLLGKEVMQQSLNTDQSGFALNIEGLANGMYFLHVSTNGKESTVIKFQKQN